jgi:hypothetical protein
MGWSAVDVGWLWNAETFHAGGLDDATVRWDIMQPDSPVFTWFAAVLKSSLPHTERLGLASAKELDLDTLEED